MAKSCRWTFTSFAHDWDKDETGEHLTDELPAGVVFMVWSKEQCPKTGKMHLQGYVHFAQAQRMSRVQNLVQDHTAHCEIAQWSEAINTKYCSKEASHIAGPFMFGTPEKEEFGQGHRTDLDKACQLAKEHGLKRVAEEMPGTYAKHFKGIAAVAAITHNDSYEPHPVDIFVIWGKSNAGKSHWARKYFQHKNYTYHNVMKSQYGSTQWMDGCQEKDAILFEDFKGQFDLDYFLALTDVWEAEFPVKFGSTRNTWKCIIFTSNTDPKMWYTPSNPELKTAYMRRITKILEATGGREQLEELVKKELF